MSRPRAVVQPLRTTSLRRRVTLSVMAVLFVVLVGVVFLVDGLFSVISNRDLGAVLVDHARVAQQLANQDVDPRVLINRVETGGVRARLTLTDGRVFGSLAGRSADNPPARTRTITLSSRGDLDDAQLVLAADTTVIANAQAQLRRLLLLVGLGALAFTGMVLVLVTRFALAPLSTMADLAWSIAGGRRGRRLMPTRADTELGRAARAFDDMLDALEGAEQQAKAAEAASRESAERTRRFVADAAHELRTPIAGVQAVAEAVLQQAVDADPEERQRLHLLLVRESRRAGHLIDDLLDLARIDAGVELDRGAVDLRSLAQAEAERTRLLAPGLTITVDGPELTVHGDGRRITQILANLLDNARQATPPDGRIGIRLGRDGGLAEVVVSDNGPGVPPKDRERIFDRLVRLDAARDRRSGGSGLGLAIARGFARAHGGELSCPPPRTGASGAVFRLVLPLSEPPTQPIPSPASAPTS